MKAAEKDQKPQVKQEFGFNLTLDKSLDKYKAPEFAPPKLAEIRKRDFSKIKILR